MLCMSRIVGLIAVRLATATLRHRKCVELDLGSVTFCLNFFIGLNFLVCVAVLLSEQSPVQLCKFKLIHLGSGVRPVHSTNNVMIFVDFVLYSGASIIPFSFRFVFIV